MLIASWIINVLLALVFLTAGAIKLTGSREKLVATASWAEEFGFTRLRFVGLLEVLGALGLTLPLAVRVAPILAPLAGAGLAVVMLFAGVLHARHEESVNANIILGALAVLSTVLGLLVLLG